MRIFYIEGLIFGVDESQKGKSSAKLVNIYAMLMVAPTHHGSIMDGNFYQRHEPHTMNPQNNTGMWWKNSIFKFTLDNNH